MKELQSESHGFRGHLKEFFTSSSVTEEIAGYQRKIQDLGSRLQVAIEFLKYIVAFDL